MEKETACRLFRIVILTAVARSRHALSFENDQFDDNTRNVPTGIGFQFLAWAGPEKSLSISLPTCS